MRICVGFLIGCGIAALIARIPLHLFRAMGIGVVWALCMDRILTLVKRRRKRLREEGENR